MFNFNLKPGHTTSADGLLESVGAFELTGNLVPGHTNAADGFLVAAVFYQAVASGEDEPGVPVEVLVSGVSATASIGVVFVTGKSNVSTSGLAANASVGDVSVFGKSQTASTGVSGNSAVGSVIATGKANVTVAGVSTTGTLGEVTVDGGDPVEPPTPPSGGGWTIFYRGRTKPVRKKTVVVILSGQSSLAQVGNLTVTCNGITPLDVEEEEAMALWLASRS